MKPRSILFLGAQMATGGAQKLLLEQAQWFYERGYNVSAIFFYDRDNLREKWKQAHPFEIRSLDAFDKQANKLRNVVNLLNGLKTLWQILKREKFDVVLTFTHDSNMLGLPLAWLAGVPVRVGTNLGEIRGMSKWRDRLHSFFVNCGIIQTLVASSTRTRNNSIESSVRPQRIKIIYNAIQPLDVSNINGESARKKLGLDKDDLFFLAVGRLVYEKGHEFFIAAMEQIAKADSRVVAGICGAGPLRETLQAQVENLSLQSRVKLLGQWDFISELLAAADVFVLPSRWEGLPLALLEAMSAELPVVATAVEGVSEVVQSGAQGILVAPQRADELARAILQLAQSPADRRRMGAAARQRVLESYTIDRMCEQYLQIFEEGLNVKKT
ncbi:MAG: glycosyltransferase [Anaerolineales bacterium]|nr:glycosyltransferase [Anaerolineales bacterium]